MDEQLIASIVEYLATHTGKKIKGQSRETETTKNQFPAFASHIRALCKHRKNHINTQYDLIGRELPSIASLMNVRSFNEDKLAKGASAASVIENALKDMGKGTRSALIEPMLKWAWERDEASLMAFLQGLGFHQMKAASPNTTTPIIRPVGSQGTSNYDLPEIFRVAEQRIVLIAQNHWHMVSSRTDDGYLYWPQIEKALRRGVTVEIIAMHPDAAPRGGFLNRKNPTEQSPLPADPLNTWANYMNCDKFVGQVDQMWEVFADWRRLYGEIKANWTTGRLGAFKTYGSYFQPNTITAVDPEKLKGFVVVSPRTSDTNSKGRPQFLLDRAVEMEAFTYYVRYISDGISNDIWPVVTD